MQFSSYEMMYVKLWIEHEYIYVKILNCGYTSINVAWEWNGKKSAIYVLENTFSITFTIPNTTTDEHIMKLMKSITFDNICILNKECTLMAGIEYGNGTMTQYKEPMHEWNPRCIEICDLMKMLSNVTGPAERMVNFLIQCKGNLALKSPDITVDQSKHVIPIPHERDNWDGFDHHDEWLSKHSQNEEYAPSDVFDY